MLQLEELLKSIDLLKESNVPIPDNIYEKIKKYEIQMIQDEFGALFNKFLLQKLQTYIKHEYSITIDYIPDEGISINISPKVSGLSKQVTIEVPLIADASTKTVGREFEEIEEKPQTSVPSSKANILKTDIKDPNNILETRNTLKVTFPNGDILHYKNKKKLLVEFTRYVGAERLHSVDKDFVTTSIHYFRISDSEKTAKYEIVTPDYWVFTDYSLQNLLKFLSELNHKLRLGAFIEIVDYYEEIIPTKAAQIDVIETFVQQPIPQNSVTDIQDNVMGTNDIQKEEKKRKTIVREEKADLNDLFQKDSPTLGNKGNFKCVSPVPDASYLTSFLNQLSNMRTDKNDSVKGPYKAILIIAIIKGIQNGRIKHNEIYLNKDLKNLFLDAWVEYIPSRNPSLIGLSTAFLHLSLEPFFHLHKKENFTNTNFDNPDLLWTITSINNVVKYAYIDDKLNDLINNDRCCEIIKEHLVNEFGLESNKLEETPKCELKAHEIVGNNSIDLYSKKEQEESELRIVERSPKSFVLYGNTTGLESFLKNQHGFFNRYLPEGAGWVFSKKKEPIIRQFLISLKSKSANNETYLRCFLDELSQMRAGIYRGQKSPHKAILILTIIQGVRSGQLEFDKIYLNDNLIRIFNDTWVKYVPSGSSFVMGISNPFVHLSSSSFYHLKTIENRKINLSLTWTIPSIHNVCEYAYIDKELCNLINDDKSYDRIIEHLKSQFGLQENVEQINAISDALPKSESSLNTTKVPSLPRQKIANKYKAAMFRLTYPNGYVEESDIYPDVFIEFIKYAGPQRVRDLDIYSLGTNLVVPKEDINLRYSSGYKDVGGGFYANTIFTTQRKYEIMTYLSEQLKLNVKVELVPNTKKR